MSEESQTPTGAETQDPPQTGGGTAPGAAKAFTQEQVDQLLRDRLARQERSFEKKLAEATEAAVSSFREERGLSDEALEKIGTVDTEKLGLKGEVKKLKSELTKLEGRYTATRNKLQSVLVDEEIAKVAAPLAAGGDVEPILALLRNRVRFVEDDLSTHVVDEKGEPSGMSVSDLVSDLLARKPQLAAATGHYGSGSPPRPPGGKKVEPADGPQRRMGILGKALGV